MLIRIGLEPRLAKYKRLARTPSPTLRTQLHASYIELCQASKA